MLILAVIIGFSIFVSTTVGFGLGLIAMPLLLTVIPLETARPLMVLIGMTAQVFTVWRYRKGLRIGSLSLLAVAGVVGIPLGVYLLPLIPEDIALAALGVLIISYALYALIGPTLPQLRWPGWAVVAGFTSGVISGAYNAGGPPVVIYGDARRWTPVEFKSNLQSFFFFKAIVLFVSHVTAGNFTRTVFVDYLVVLPGIGLGLLLGFSLDNRIDAQLFRRLALFLLLITGTNLIF